MHQQLLFPFYLPPSSISKLFKELTFIGTVTSIFPEFSLDTHIRAFSYYASSKYNVTDKMSNKKSSTAKLEIAN